MNGSDRARDVLAWIDWCDPWRIEQTRRACRGRKDVERLRARLRAQGAPPEFVSVVTRAAQKRDLETLLRIDWVSA